MDGHSFILEEKNINKLILSMSWPIVLAFLFQTSFNIIDGIFVGRISADALAAVSVSFPIFMLLISLAGGLGIGTTSLIARSIGAKHFKKADNVAEHSVLTAVVLSLLFTATGIFFGKPLFSLVGADESIMSMVLGYANIIFISNIFMFLAFIANYILRGEGEMKSSMFAMGFSAVLNIILDPLFIFVFGWGVEGAAWATVLARAVGCIIAFSYIFSKKSTINLSLFDFKFDFNIIKEIFVIGIPSSLSQLINSLSLFAITGIVAGFGSGALAAFGIIFRSEGLMFMPVLGVMTAVITIVGQNFGAGKVRRSRKIALNASLIVAAFSMFIGIFYFLFSEQLALLFNSDPVVVHYVSLYFLINFWTYPFMAVMMIIIASFLGAGKPFPPLMINLVRMFVITIPFAYFFSKNFGLIGVWWCFPIAILFSFFLSLVWFLVVDFHHSK